MTHTALVTHNVCKDLNQFPCLYQIVWCFFETTFHLLKSQKLVHSKNLAIFGSVLYLYCISNLQHVFTVLCIALVTLTQCTRDSLRHSICMEHTGSYCDSYICICE